MLGGDDNALLPSADLHECMLPMEMVQGYTIYNILLNVLHLYKWDK